MFDYYEVAWEMEDLSAEEMEVLVSAWEELDDCDREWYDDFEEFCEDYIARICYPEV